MTNGSAKGAATRTDGERDEGKIRGSLRRKKRADGAEDVTAELHTKTRKRGLRCAFARFNVAFVPYLRKSAFVHQHGDGAFDEQPEAQVGLFFEGDFYAGFAEIDGALSRALEAHSRHEFAYESR